MPHCSFVVYSTENWKKKKESSDLRPAREILVWTGTCSIHDSMFWFFLALLALADYPIFQFFNVSRPQQNWRFNSTVQFFSEYWSSFLNRMGSHTTLDKAALLTRFSSDCRASTLTMTTYQVVSRRFTMCYFETEACLLKCNVFAVLIYDGGLHRYWMGMALGALVAASFVMPSRNWFDTWSLWLYQ
jgi:hypothetical protein